MKKLILLLLSLLIIGLPCFAEYKPIPKELSKQYKKEMEQIIKQEYPKYFSRIKNYDEVIKAEDPEYRYTTINIGLQTEIFEFLMPLINTTDKYVGIKKDIPVTDFWPDLYDVLYPYLQNNCINTRLIDKLIKYSDNKERKLKKKFLTKNDYLKDYVQLNSKISYNWTSLKYHKLTKVHTIDIITDLGIDYKMCKYPHKNGCISHLIFNTKLFGNKLHIKYKGYIVSSRNSNYMASKGRNMENISIITIKKRKPGNLKQIKQIEKNIYEQIDIIDLKQQLKIR